MSTYFPISIPPIADSGAYVSHWDAMPRDWNAVTDRYEYQDGGKDFNEVSSNAPRRWRLELTCDGGGAGHAGHLAAKAIADVYEAFFNSNRYTQPFYFEDKYGDTWSDIRIEEYERTHDAHKSWIIYVRFTLVGTTQSAIVMSHVLFGSDRVVLGGDPLIFNP
jgi:hypothetical protein